MLATAREHRPGRVVAPDLPGHGDSPPLERYSFDSLSDAVARVVDDAAELVVLGHSLGGVLALGLASGSFDVQPRAVIGLGIKVAWSEDDLGRAAALAGKERNGSSRAPRRSPATCACPGSPVSSPTRASLRREAFGRRGVATGSHSTTPHLGVGEPDMTGLLAAARCQVTLARGEHDALNTDAQLRELVADPVSLPRLGHNAHVEGSAAIWSLVASTLRG